MFLTFLVIACSHETEKVRVPGSRLGVNPSVFVSHLSLRLSARGKEWFVLAEIWVRSMKAKNPPLLLRFRASVTLS